MNEIEQQREWDEKTRRIDKWNAYMKVSEKSVKTKTPKLTDKKQWQIINVHILKMVYTPCTQWFHLVGLIAFPKRNEAIPDPGIDFFAASLHQQLSAFTSIARYVINSFQIGWGMCRSYNGRTAKTLLCFYPFFSLIWCIHRKFIYWGFFFASPHAGYNSHHSFNSFSISVTDPIHSISRCEKSVSHRK